MCDQKFTSRKSKECRLCLETLSDPYNLQCGHLYFHRHCLERHFKPECPICKAPHDLEVHGEEPEENIIYDGGYPEVELFNPYYTPSPEISLASLEVIHISEPFYLRLRQWTRGDCLVVRHFSPCSFCPSWLSPPPPPPPLSPPPSQLSIDSYHLNDSTPFIFNWQIPNEYKRLMNNLNFIFNTIDKQTCKAIMNIKCGKERYLVILDNTSYQHRSIFRYIKRNFHILA